MSQPNEKRIEEIFEEICASRKAKGEYISDWQYRDIGEVAESQEKRERLFGKKLSPNSYKKTKDGF
jgi:hypothetical protein